jgi:hypothetical protein
MRTVRIQLPDNQRKMLLEAAVSFKQADLESDSKFHNRLGPVWDKIILKLGGRKNGTRLRS